MKFFQNPQSRILPPKANPLRADNSRLGQSLVEILIAISIGSVMILGTLAVIVSSLKSSAETSRIQVATGLGKELMENVRVFTEGDWYNLSSLTKGSANHYHLATSTSPFTVLAGDETLQVGTSTYVRYFYVEDVGRDGAGNILGSGGSTDPSTQRVTVAFRPVSTPAPKTIATYLTRSRNVTYIQTDWSGGPGIASPATSTDNRFSNATNTAYASTTGSLYINGL